MVKKKYNDDLFVYLDWILKKPVKDLHLQSVPSIYITNRWLSMSSKEIAQIVNTTFNRWIKSKVFSSDNLLAGKFYRTVLPQTKKHIKYLKKDSSSKNKECEDISSLSRNLELSQREIELYNKTLDILKF